MVRTICSLHLSLPDTTHGRFKYHVILTGDHVYTTGVHRHLVVEESIHLATTDALPFFTKAIGDLSCACR